MQDLKTKNEMCQSTAKTTILKHTSVSEQLVGAIEY